MDNMQREITTQYLTVLVNADMDTRVRNNLQLLTAWLNNEVEHTADIMRLKLEICRYGNPHWRGDCEELKCST
jgi:hypothetical protein